MTTGNRFRDLTGQVFGKLTVLKFAGKNSKGRHMWNCKCECGKETTVQGLSLKSGHTKGCGCNAMGGFKHGDSGSHFWNKWRGMRARCNNNVNYIHLTVDPQWNNYLNFKEDMHKSYLQHTSIHGEDDTELDRIDGEKGYMKANCRWVTNAGQARNRSGSLLTRKWLF